jgi:CheY-like chemotaxis protein
MNTLGIDAGAHMERRNGTPQVAPNIFTQSLSTSGEAAISVDRAGPGGDPVVLVEPVEQELPNDNYPDFITVDGAEGVALARSEGPELILMDLSLPVMDGWEATRRLKADAETRSIPVIALSAHAMSGDKEKALEAGCDDYDSKPIEFPRLLGKIEALLGRAPAQ